MGSWGCWPRCAWRRAWPRSCSRILLDTAGAGIDLTRVNDLLKKLYAKDVADTFFDSVSDPWLANLEERPWTAHS